MREDPATEFPQKQIFGKSYRRSTPHIYTEEEVLALLAAARHLAPARGLRLAAYEALYGLIAAAGLRVAAQMTGRLTFKHNVLAADTDHVGMRAPVLYIMLKNARSCCLVQLGQSGDSMMASISARDRKPTIGWSNRLSGIEVIATDVI